MSVTARVCRTKKLKAAAPRMREERHRDHDLDERETAGELSAWDRPIIVLVGGASGTVDTGRSARAPRFLPRVLGPTRAWTHGRKP